MNKRLTRYLGSIWDSTIVSYKEIIFLMLTPDPEVKLLDLGCTNGTWADILSMIDKKHTTLLTIKTRK